MTKFSNWELIPDDRKCDLPDKARVQVMWRNEDAEYAEENNTSDRVINCLHRGLWLKDIFAFRRVIEDAPKHAKLEAENKRLREALASICNLEPNGLRSLIQLVRIREIVDDALAEKESE